MQQNLAKGSSQFHCYQWIFTLIKYSSLLGVKNIRSVLRIWGQNNGNYSNVAKINAPLNQWPEINLYKNQCNSKLTPSFQISDNLIRH